MDNLNKQQKNLLRFSKEEVAASVVFNEFQTASENLTMTKYLIEASKDAADEIEGGPVEPDRKIRTGMIKRNLAADLGKSEEEIDAVGGQGDE